jgi:hypothetical protein
VDFRITSGRRNMRLRVGSTRALLAARRQPLLLLLPCVETLPSAERSAPAVRSAALWKLSEVGGLGQVILIPRVTPLLSDVIVIGVEVVVGAVVV